MRRANLAVFQSPSRRVLTFRSAFNHRHCSSSLSFDSSTSFDSDSAAVRSAGLLWRRDGGLSGMENTAATPAENVEQWLIRMLQDTEEGEQRDAGRRFSRSDRQSASRIGRLSEKLKVSASSSMVEKSKEPYLSLSRRFLSVADTFKRTPSSEASAELSVWPDVDYVERTLVSSYEELRCAMMTMMAAGQRESGNDQNDAAGVRVDSNLPDALLPDRVIVIVSHSHTNFSNAVQNSLTRITAQAARMIESHKSALCTVTVFNGYRPMELTISPEGRVNVCGLAANGAPVLCYPEGGIYSLSTLLRSLHSSFKRTTAHRLDSRNGTPCRSFLPLDWRVFVLSDSFFHVRTITGMLSDCSAAAPSSGNHGSNTSESRCFQWTCDATPYTVTPGMTEKEELALSRYLYASAME